MAVPSGQYEIEAAIDLSPVFGKIVEFATVEVRVPSEKILEDRLTQLRSEDENQRRLALIDLRYFRDDAERVVPALITCLDDEVENIRMVALSVLMSYPDEAAAHLDRFYTILEGTDGIGVRGSAAYLIARIAPVGDRAEQALTKAIDTAEDNLKPRLEAALSMYRRRAGAD